MLAGWFCLVAWAPALAATVVRAQPSYWSHFRAPWGLLLLPREAWPLDDPLRLISSGFLACPHLFQTTCCAGIALERHRALCSREAGCAAAGLPGQALGFSLKDRHPSPPPVIPGVLHPCPCPSNCRHPGHSCTLPPLGSPYVILCTLGSKIRQRSG